MVSDLLLLSHTDLPPVILVLLPQSLRQHLSTDTQLAGAYDSLNLDGFLSPYHPHAVTQNSSLSSLDFSDLTLNLPALPTPEASGQEDKESSTFGSTTPTSEDKRFGMDVDDLSQWQSEFRNQIQALRQWLRSMEMRLPPLDPRTDTKVVLLCSGRETSLGHRGTEGLRESGSIVRGVDSLTREGLGSEGSLST
ncbi:unnamed protein product [Pleuronectes platessa]|uniref:Uncharacterized protein n=1 Tax=Pleuronectes platessa TaxID=8262 RepID=A0A9N7U3B2_PLEPL|nr:unnamed protein product [Pleuronectes platessa]